MSPLPAVSRLPPILAALRAHWPEYLIEGTALGAFMISAGLFGTLLEAPGSPLYEGLPDPFARRALAGLAMGLTAVAIIYSPWGKRSGAHMNPAVTLTFLRLRKVERWDAVFYIAAQIAGGTAAVVAVAAALGEPFELPPVRFVVTVPGAAGPLAAFAAELAISFALMAAVLVTSNRERLAPYTGLVAGLLVAAFITFEAPFSGMSINPARTLASALPARLYEAFWVYMTAPVLGMLAAGELYRRGAGNVVRCAKLNHRGRHRCIFRCGYCTHLPQEG